jgi:hypothetical protein
MLKYFEVSATQIDSKLKATEICGKLAATCSDDLTCSTFSGYVDRSDLQTAV